MNEKLKDLEADACTVRQGPRKGGNLAEKLEDTKGGEECGESFQSQCLGETKQKKKSEK